MEKDILKNIAKTLNILLKANNLNMTKLSEVTGIPRTTISHWINQIYSPKIESLWILADCFNCTVDYLIGREV